MDERGLTVHRTEWAGGTGGRGQWTWMAAQPGTHSDSCEDSGRQEGGQGAYTEQSVSPEPSSVPSGVTRDSFCGPPPKNVSGHLQWTMLSLSLEVQLGRDPLGQ